MYIARRNNFLILIITLLIYSFNRFYLKSVVELPVLSNILRNHFNDFLAGIAFLAYLNFILSFYKHGIHQIRSYKGVALVAFLCGVFWEFVTPLYKESSTSDWLDVLSYILGALSYKAIVTVNKMTSKGKDTIKGI